MNSLTASRGEEAIVLCERRSEGEDEKGFEGEPGGAIGEVEEGNELG
jgi:hypothetical protein